MIIIGRNWLGDVKRYEADSIAAVLTTVYGPVTRTGYTADTDGRVSWGVFGNLGYVTGPWGDHVATYYTLVDGQAFADVSLITVSIPGIPGVRVRWFAGEHDMMPIDACDTFEGNPTWNCPACGLLFPTKSELDAHTCVNGDDEYTVIAAPSQTALRLIQSRDPDGGDVEPTEAMYAAHKAWAVSMYGPDTWEVYAAGGWGHQPGDEPRHVEY